MSQAATSNRTPGNGALGAVPGPHSAPCPAFTQQLERDGIVALRAADCFTPETLSALRTVATEFVNGPRVREESLKFHAGSGRDTVKQWMVKYQEKQSFAPDHPLYLAGVELVPLVESIIGLCRYISADLWYALPGAEQRGRKWSQNWHRDPEGSDCVIKAMLFLSDVDEQGGPFEYMLGTHVKGFEACPVKSYLTAEGAAQLRGTGIVRLVCPADTLVIANTVGLHRGGATRSKSRLSTVWTYVPASNQIEVKFSVN